MRAFLLFALLAAPALRAGDGRWINSPGQDYSLRLPAGWPAGPAPAKLTPPGMTQLFSLSPKSRAFVMNVSCDEASPRGSMLLKTYYDTAREIAGGSFPEESVPAGGSRFVCFRSSEAAGGRPVYLVRGLLYAPEQEFYVTFSSSRGWPAGEDWQAALEALAALRPGASGDGGEQKAPAVPVKLPPTGMTPGGRRPLSETPALRAGGGSAAFKDIVIFACNGIPDNRYLFNKDRTGHCRINSPADYTSIAQKLGGVYWGENTVIFDECPPEMAGDRPCDPAKLRDF